MTLPSITIGTPVAFLPGGDFDAARPGQIDSIGVKGMFDVVFHAKGGGRHIVQRGTRHHQHPDYQNPKRKDLMSQVGTFYMLQEFEVERQSQIDEERAKHAKREDDQERLLAQRVINMFIDGVSLQEIAAATQIGVPKVEQIIHFYQQQNPQNPQQAQNVQQQPVPQQPVPQQPAV
jgi:hypothetical protein